MFFVLTEFELQLDNFMLYCSSENLAVKMLKSYEQTIRYVFMRKIQFKILNSFHFTNLSTQLKRMGCPSWFADIVARVIVTFLL